MNTLSLFAAEGRKLKGSAAFYLVPLTVLCLLGIVLLAHSLDVHRLAVLGKDPWPRFFRTATTSYAMVLASPLCVLLTAALLYLENRADAWKQLYALPSSRASILLTKLGVLLLLNVIALSLYFLGLWAGGNLLGSWFPEYEMDFFTPDLTSLWASATQLFIACLGLIGCQFLLGLLFKNVLIPLGIGFFGIIAGFILSTTSLSLTRWIPYAYPLIATNSNATNAVHQEVLWLGLHPAVVGSLLWFVVSIGIALWWEQRRR